MYHLLDHVLIIALSDICVKDDCPDRAGYTPCAKTAKRRMMGRFIPIWEKPMLTNATFKIVSWDEEPFDESEDGPKLTRAHIRRTFHGDLSGTGNLMYVMAHLSGEDATFSGFEKVVGSLGGRTGSFALRHTGSYDGETATAEYEVVPGSGTGELAGLSGTGGFSAGHAVEHDMTLEYEV